VGFVDEEDDGGGRALHLFNEALEAVFELALDAGAGLEEGEVEGANGDVAEGRGDIAGGDAGGEAFDDGGFADAGLTGEDGVVLAAAHENVDDLTDLRIAAENGVDFAGLGEAGEVGGELIEVGGFATAGAGCAGGGGAAGASGLVGFGRVVVLLTGVGEEAGELGFEGDGIEARDLAAGLADGAPEGGGLGEGEEDVAGADFAGTVLERADGPGLGEEVDEVLGEGRSAGVAALDAIEGLGEFVLEAAGIDAEAVQDAGAVVVGLVEEPEQVVLELDVVVGAGDAEAGGSLERLTRGVIELPDERFQASGHRMSSPLPRGGIPCRPDRDPWARI